MKKIGLVIAFFFIHFSSKSQVIISLLLGDALNNERVEFGLDGGLTMSNYSNANGKYSQTFNIGFYFDIRLNNPKWYFITGVQVKSNMGAKELPVYLLNDAFLDSGFAGGSVTRKVAYFNEPFMIRRLFYNKIFIEGGIQTGLRSKAYDYFYADIPEEDDTYHKRNLNSELARIDFGLTVGAGYRLMGGNGMNLSARYYHGVINTLKDPALSAQQNRSFYFNVGIPIGKHPKK